MLSPSSVTPDGTTSASTTVIVTTHNTRHGRAVNFAFLAVVARLGLCFGDSGAETVKHQQAIESQVVVGELRAGDPRELWGKCPNSSVRHTDRELHSHGVRHL